MFYNAHAYVASKLHKSEDNLLLIGSILPDIAIMKIIDWDNGLHGKENTRNFIKFIQEENPNYLFLGKGVYTHCILDDVSHLKYHSGVGYAYQNNEELSELVGEYYNEDKEMAKRKAHNYIESGVDILLLKENPEIQGLVEQAFEKVDLDELSVLLSLYFKIDKEKFKQTISQYFNLITKNDLRNKDNWIFFWEDLNKIMGLKKIEETKIKTLLDKSIDLTKDTYKDFLHYSITEGLKEI